MEQLLGRKGEAMDFAFIFRFSKLKLYVLYFLIIIIIHVDVLIMENTETVK